ncbi:Cystathionine gamma-synthase [Penicillium angulare]|uniref:Cystathionine gamma-synthase n=1 Tax=Penicillium angulare TaxID=116970 RepID=A0A9W9EVI9_9EURO|nr:Cystathionine gamma-synthase [Penicillium angulare]
MIINLESINPLPLTPAMGQPVPNVHHAVSVQLPTWDDIKEMFTGAVRVKSQQVTGYPRSFIHQDVKQLHKECIDKFANDSTTCFLFPSFEYAQKCYEFATSSAIHQEAALPEQMLSLRSIEIIFEEIEEGRPGSRITLHGVFCPEDQATALHTFWRLVGAGISSRLAEHVVRHKHTLIDVTGRSSRVPYDIVRGRWTERPHRQLCQRIANLLERAPSCITRAEPVARDDVYLYNTGMAAIYHAQQLLLQWQGTSSVVFGFPYELTLKLLETFGPAVKFFPFGSENDLDLLDEHLAGEAAAGRSVQAIWCECPSNPLLKTANLRRIRSIADRYRTAVIVDETIGGFGNVDLLGVADMLVTSLTKSFSGSADVMAGSIVLNPASDFYADWKQNLETNYRNCLFTADAAQLEENSRDLLMRTTQINETASYLVKSLLPLIDDDKSAVTQLFYPEIDPASMNYRAQMRQSKEDFKPGYGGLFTLQFETVELASVFFNALDVHKGPSLGAPVTLAQPYVQTVFHKQKEWAGECGLHESIVRVSVGMEDKRALLAAFRTALAIADSKKAMPANKVNGDISTDN